MFNSEQKLRFKPGAVMISLSFSLLWLVLCLSALRRTLAGYARAETETNADGAGGASRRPNSQRPAQAHVQRS